MVLPIPVPEMPILEIPQWLSGISGETMQEQPFPLCDILQDSLYYPASGLQGAPIQYLAGHILSFVYVDYGYCREEFRGELEHPGIMGYDCLGIRAVEQELAPENWRLEDLRRYDGDPKIHKNRMKPHFCDWVVFRRREEYGNDHGPDRFSLLFLCADGVEAFQVLYAQNNLTPKAIAIIQSQGGNWTDFGDSMKILGRSVLGNPGGKPELLLNGGRGGRGGLKGINARPWWSIYKNPVMVNSDGSNFLGDTGISVWTTT